MFPDDADVQRVKAHIFDPFEYLMLREKEGLLNKEFYPAAGQDQLPRFLSPARTEYRLQDP
ncbi:MAG: hypothetical protein R3E95_16610 [Thiolinea sp.]